MNKILLTLLAIFIFICPIANAQQFDPKGDEYNQFLEDAKKDFDQLSEAEKIGQAVTPNTVGGAVLDYLTFGGSAVIRGIRDYGVVTKTYKDADGNEWEININTRTGRVTMADGVMENCAPLPSKILEFSGCNMCPMFKVLFDTANQLIQKSFTTMAYPLRNIMSIIFAIIIAIKTLSQISSLSNVSSASYIDDILKQTIKFIIAFLFLTFYKEVFYWIINPLLYAAIEMGSGFLENSQDLNSIEPTIKGATGAFISGDIYNKIDAFYQAVQQELGFIQAIGSSLICISFNSASVAEIFPDVSLFSSGMTLMIASIIVSIGFSYYLIDGILQLCLVGILTPFSLASYPFGFSLKWMMTTWKIFLDTLFKFIFMGLIINLIVKILMFATTGGLGGSELIIAAMNEDSPETLANFFNITSTAYITFTICAIFAYRLTGEATKLAASLSGGSIISAGSAIGAMALQAITKPAKKLGGKALGAGKKKAQAAGKKISNDIKDKRKQIKASKIKESIK